MIVEPFQTFHVELMRAQGIQPAQVSYVPASYASVQRPPGTSMTVRDGERLVLCGGVIPTGPKVGLLWALLSKDAGRHMVWLDRATRRFLTLESWRRIEATVEKGFPAGCRWIELLGFGYEGEMPAYGPNGETHLRYGKVWLSSPP